VAGIGIGLAKPATPTVNPCQFSVVCVNVNGVIGSGETNHPVKLTATEKSRSRCIKYGRSGSPRPTPNTIEFNWHTKLNSIPISTG
jgi:hypothetical protein